MTPACVPRGAVYSVILSQIYAYYFERQASIQDAIFEEASALRLLMECAECVATARPASVRRPRLLGVLSEHVAAVRGDAFDASTRDDERSTMPLVRLLGELEGKGADAASAGAGAAPEGAGCAETVRLARVAVGRVGAARATRISATRSELPPVQTLTQRVIAFVLLLGFVLVDLGAPRLEALLFAVLAGSFFLISSFLEDLADPFGGSWSVGAAVEEVEQLQRAIEAARQEADA